MSDINDDTKKTQIYQSSWDLDDKWLQIYLVKILYMITNEIG